MTMDSRTRWLALLVVCLGDLMIVLDVTIVGVAPEGFQGMQVGEKVDLYLPLLMAHVAHRTTESIALTERGDWWLARGTLDDVFSDEPDALLKRARARARRAERRGPAGLSRPLDDL